MYQETPQKFRLSGFLCPCTVTRTKENLAYSLVQKFLTSEAINELKTNEILISHALAKSRRKRSYPLI